MSALVEEAVAAWLAAFDTDGKELPAADIAARFDRSPRWGRDVVAEARQILADRVEEDTATPQHQVHQAPQVAPMAEPPLPPVAAVPEVAENGKPSGHAVALGGFVFGIAGSVMANVLHAALSGAGVAAILASAFWPVALLLATEVLIRVQWPEGAWYGLARFGGLSAVAVVAGLVSYSHMSALLGSWGEPWAVSHLGPVAVDGLMVLCAAALLAIQRGRRAER
jgi:hypothetical protein